jgi:hypothetical protein
MTILKLRVLWRLNTARWARIVQVVEMETCATGLTEVVIQASHYRCTYVHAGEVVYWLWKLIFINMKVMKFERHTVWETRYGVEWTGCNIL